MSQRVFLIEYALWQKIEESHTLYERVFVRSSYSTKPNAAILLYHEAALVVPRYSFPREQDQGARNIETTWIMMDRYKF